MILGVITTRHVLRHAPTILRGFGVAVFLRCCLATVRRRRATFLECIFAARAPMPAAAARSLVPAGITAVAARS